MTPAELFILSQQEWADTAQQLSSLDPDTWCVYVPTARPSSPGDWISRDDGSIGAVVIRSADASPPPPELTGGGYRISTRRMLSAARAPTAGKEFRLLAFVHRREDVSPAQFRAHWEHGHAPLVERSVPLLVQYIQHVVLDRPDDDAEAIDGVAELVFATKEDWQLRRFTDASAERAVRADEATFVDQLASWQLAVDVVNRSGV